jgi:flagellar motor protein MotB
MTGRNKKKPFWMPTGGLGASVFWAGFCLFLAATTIYYYTEATANEKQTREMRGQEQLLFRENQKLRSEVDKLQTEVVEAGGLLRNREKVLEQAAESLKAVQNEKEKQSALPPIIVPLTPAQLRQELLAKAEAARQAYPALMDCVVVETATGILLRVSNADLFNPGEPNVSPKGVALLVEVAAWLKEIAPQRLVELQSHTDNVTPSGSQATVTPTNWEVSARRAIAIMRVLSGEGELLVQNLKPVAMGESQPLAPNDTKENRAINRRLEIHLQP